MQNKGFDLVVQSLLKATSPQASEVYSDMAEESHSITPTLSGLL